LFAYFIKYLFFPSFNDVFGIIFHFMDMDEIDLRLLEMLQQDATLTNEALAQRCHVSPPTALRRVRRLADAGMIERQVAILSPEKLAAPLLTAIVEVTLSETAAERLTAFETLIAGEAAVQQCYRVNQGPDFVLVLVTRDMAAYHALVQRLLTAANNVRNVRTFFSQHRSKFTTAIPLPSARQ
jgi:Lrp/AsnC family transcriptional regulator, leucine-responsive regulatory protein